MLINTKCRTQAAEIMDDFSMEGETLRAALDEIARINRLLGGNDVTLSGVAALMKQLSSGRQVTIADIGCGNGDMLRTLSHYARRKKWNLRLLGIDANEFTVGYAEKLSAHYPDIHYHCRDVITQPLDQAKYDIILCTLTLHHFKDEEILQLLSVFRERATVGVVINDLHRSALAYRLFQLVSMVFRFNDMSREDGLTSILRGFKRQEIHDLSKKLDIVNYTLRWKWAFRYQWIISNL